MKVVSLLIPNRQIIDSNETFSLLDKERATI
jgi:hypothetical protein